jgi:hypothetical protein
MCLLASPEQLIVRPESKLTPEQRRATLKAELDKHKLALREDSSVCHSFIAGESELLAR